MTRLWYIGVTDGEPVIRSADSVSSISFNRSALSAASANGTASQVAPLIPQSGIAVSSIPRSTGSTGSMANTVSSSPTFSATSGIQTSSAGASTIPLSSLPTSSVLRSSVLTSPVSSVAPSPLGPVSTLRGFFDDIDQITQDFADKSADLNRKIQSGKQAVDNTIRDVKQGADNIKKRAEEIYNGSSQQVGNSPAKVTVQTTVPTTDVGTQTKSYLPWLLLAGAGALFLIARK